MSLAAPVWSPTTVMRLVSARESISSTMPFKRAGSAKPPYSSPTVRQISPLSLSFS
jgi:hypothetical protein